MTESQIILAKEFAWMLHCLFETNNYKYNLPQITLENYIEVQHKVDDQEERKHRTSDILRSLENTYGVKGEVKTLAFNIYHFNKHRNVNSKYEYILPPK